MKERTGINGVTAVGAGDVVYDGPAVVSSGRSSPGIRCVVKEKLLTIFAPLALPIGVTTSVVVFCVLVPRVSSSNGVA